MALTLRNQRAIKSFHLSERLGPAERLRNRFAAPAQTRCDGGVVQNLGQASLERGAIMAHDETRALIDNRRDSAAIGDQNRSAARDRLRRSVAEILVLRRQNEYIRVPIGRPFGVAVKRAREQYA